MQAALLKLRKSLVNNGKIKSVKRKKIKSQDYTGCLRILVRIYEVIRFFISNSDSLMDTDTQRLYTFEPENEKVNTCTKYIKKIVFIVLAFVGSIYVISTNV